MGSLKSIYRDERNGFQGWRVKIKRLKREHLKYFNDGRDSPANSLRRAIAYRDPVIRQLPPPHRICSSHARNTSGRLSASRERSRSLQPALR